MKAEWKEYIAILKQEVIPALGCTEPVTVALAAAKATEVLGCEPEDIHISVSGNLFKNAMGVSVPGTGMTGPLIAAAAGSLGGDASLNLQVLQGLTPKTVAKAKDMLRMGNVTISIANTEELLFARVIVSHKENSASCTIAREHAQVTEITKNNTVIFSKELGPKNESEESWSLTISKIHELATNAPFEQIEFILEAAKLNKEVASEGLKHDFGLMVGRSMEKDISMGLRSDDITLLATRLSAAASDARMAGISLPVMSNSGSGNQGISATMPVVAFAQQLEKTDEELARALILSHLTSIHLKHHLGRLSALCGAILAATGSGCAITMLLGGGIKEIECTIKNMVGSIAGMVCDGAKTSCALKVAASVEAAITAASLAMKGVCIPGDDGIVADNIEECIQNLGRLGAEGMVDTDKVILNIMRNK